MQFDLGALLWPPADAPRPPSARLARRKESAAARTTPAPVDRASASAGVGGRRAGQITRDALAAVGAGRVNASPGDRFRYLARRALLVSQRRGAVLPVGVVTLIACNAPPRFCITFAFNVRENLLNELCFKLDFISINSVVSFTVLSNSLKSGGVSG